MPRIQDSTSRRYEYLRNILKSHYPDKFWSTPRPWKKNVQQRFQLYLILSSHSQTISSFQIRYLLGSNGNKVNNLYRERATSNVTNLEIIQENVVMQVTSAETAMEKTIITRPIRSTINHLQPSPNTSSIGSRYSRLNDLEAL